MVVEAEAASSLVKKNMSEASIEEIEALHREFEWVLTKEVKTVLEQLKAVIKVCAAVCCGCIASKHGYAVLFLSDIGRMG